MNQFLGTPGGETVFCCECGALDPASIDCPSVATKVHHFVVYQAGIHVCTNCGQQPGAAQSFCPAGKSHRWFRMPDVIR